MKVLLVYPKFPETYWSFRHALAFEGKRSAFPPLGLLTVSAMLPAAWERRLVDMNIQPLKMADVKWADVVFCSAMLVQKGSLRRVIALCKKKGRRVVVGGPYVTTSAEDFSQADHVFLGEAETTLPEFVRDVERGEAERVYQAAERPALTATPVPDFPLANGELLQGMRSAGFRRVFLGIETPVAASLKEAQKGQNIRGGLLDSVRKIQSYGMEVMAGFIVGSTTTPRTSSSGRSNLFVRALFRSRWSAC